jgi:hypothetical protein
MTLAWKTAGGLLLLASALFPASVQAYTVGINGGTRMVYLRVGTGGMSGGNYSDGGTPSNLATINTVSVDVPAAAVGNGVDQTMAGDGSTTSQWDGYGFCDAGEIYIGAFFRHPSNGGGGGGPNNTATVIATYAATLSNASGDTIPMSQISWTASGNGDAGGQPFPSGTFTGSGQTVAAFVRNQWNESCHRFSYGNDQLVAAGTYTNRVTYTITAP